MQPNLPLICLCEDLLSRTHLVHRVSVRNLPVKSQSKKKKVSDTEREQEWVRPNISEERRRLRLSKLTQRRTRNPSHPLIPLTFSYPYRCPPRPPSPLCTANSTTHPADCRRTGWMDALTGKKKKRKENAFPATPPASALLRTTPALPNAILPPLPGPLSFPSMGFRI